MCVVCMCVSVSTDQGQLETHIRRAFHEDLDRCTGIDRQCNPSHMCMLLPDYKDRALNRD